MPSLRHLLGLGPAKTPGPAEAPLPRPDPPVCLVGDLHGMADLMEAMLARIATRPGAADARLIFVGDLIDRGPDSAAVLTRIRGLTQAHPDRVVCLMGNHERMLLDFLAEPATAALRWLRSGGSETLSSFGISAHLRRTDPANRFADLAGALRAALPDGLVEWIGALPLYWQTEGLAVVHADADPALALDAQLPKTLLWGRGPASRPRPDGLWLAHGHVIVPQVRMTAGHIALDTGACRTGRLSALWLDTQGAEVLEVTTAP